MANTRQIKRRITSAHNISKITNAMEMVAASKMKKAQNQAIESRPYSQALSQSLKKIAQFTNSSLHPLLSQHYTGIPILVIVSTDKGLCGGLNTNLLKRTLIWKKKHPEGHAIVIGKRGVNFTRLANLKVDAQFTDLPEIISQADIIPIIQLIKTKFLAQTYNSIDIVYTDFINTLSQQTEIVRLLPIAKNEAEFIPEQPKPVNPQVMPSYIFEPGPQQLLDYLLPYYLENTLYHIMLESKASEHSARMVAMKNASENAMDLVSELQLIFNKSRQAAITSELLDITTAVMSLSS